MSLTDYAAIRNEVNHVLYSLKFVNINVYTMKTFKERILAAYKHYSRSIVSLLGVCVRRVSYYAMIVSNVNVQRLWP